MPANRTCLPNTGLPMPQGSSTAFPPSHVGLKAAEDIMDLILRGLDPFPGLSHSFQTLGERPQGASALSAILTLLSKLQMECWQACLYLQSYFISEAQRGETRQARAASQAERKRRCSAGKQEPSDKETIPAGRTRFWRPSHKQLLQEQGCKSHKASL